MNDDRGRGRDGRGAECRRTRDLIDRIVADTVTPADREHAAACPDCGPVLARAARFDDALRRTARAYAVEELPRGILDPAVTGGLAGVRHGSTLRRFSPGLTGAAAAVALLVLATGVALAPGGIANPTVSPPPVESSFTATLPVFHPSAVIEAQLAGLPWVCDVGKPLATSGPGQPEREGIICATTKEDRTMQSALITSESADGQVVMVTIKGELSATDTVTATDTLATAMAKLTYASIADPVDAPAAGDWVNAEVRKLRVLPGGDSVVRDIGDIRLTLERSPSGDFFLLLEPLAPS